MRPSFISTPILRMFLMSASGSRIEHQQVGDLAGSRGCRESAGAPDGERAVLGRRDERLHRRHARAPPAPRCRGSCRCRGPASRASGVRDSSARRGPVVVGAHRHDGAGGDQRLRVLAAHLQLVAACRPRRLRSSAEVFARAGPPSCRPPLSFFCASSRSFRCFVHASPVIVLTSIEQTICLSTIARTRASRQLARAEHLGMLDAVDAGLDRQPQAVGRGGVGLGLLAALVRFLDHHALRLGREADERRPREVRGAAVLDEVGPLVEIRVDGRRAARRASCPPGLRRRPARSGRSSVPGTA